jgi:broad specificity phosphatase PhoE
MCFGVGFVLTVVYLFTVQLKATLYKIHLFKNSFSFLVFCKDLTWKKEIYQHKRPKRSVKSSSERFIIFVRHGESTWNVTFNRSKNPLFFIPRILYALLVEAYLLFIGARDSWFYDSPLCEEGLEQADEIRQLLQNLTPNSASNSKTPREITSSGQKEELMHVLNGTSPIKSVIVTSNLRRALSTISIALYNRQQRTEEKIIVVPFLQEISRNPDTLSITPPRVPPLTSFKEKRFHLDLAKLFATGINVSNNSGNKSLSSTGFLRLLGFCDWVFANVSEPVVIASGHSLWFRHFFRELLPVELQHRAKTSKIHNGGAVGCWLVKEVFDDGTVHYSVDPDSIVEIHKGFSS